MNPTNATVASAVAPASLGHAHFTRFRSASVCPEHLRLRHGYWFVFVGGSLVLWQEEREHEHEHERERENESSTTPTRILVEAIESVEASTEAPSEHMPERVRACGADASSVQYLGEYDGVPCWAAQVQQEHTAEERNPQERKHSSALPSGLVAKSLRGVYGQISDDLWVLAGRAFHVLDWAASSRFCPRCGTETSFIVHHNEGDGNHERAKRCRNEQCRLTQYPRIAPAVIMLVHRTTGGRREALFSRSAQFPSRMFSVQAGFVEPGETLEEAVERELHEETRLNVRGVRYYGSQPWPFPNSLMVGFMAEYASGELHIDGNELVEAAWLAADSLPESIERGDIALPPRASIARHLIDAWLAGA
jgi:NAD+ diphosphatase